MEIERADIVETGYTAPAVKRVDWLNERLQSRVDPLARPDGGKARVTRPVYRDEYLRPFTEQAR